MDEKIKSAMHDLWAYADGNPRLVMVGSKNHRLIRKEWAALDAKERFAGRNWRRIKREMNKARKGVE